MPRSPFVRYGRSIRQIEPRGFTLIRWASMRGNAYGQYWRSMALAARLPRFSDSCQSEQAPS